MASETQIRHATTQDSEVVANILKEAARWLDQAGMPLWREDELESARIVTDVSSGLFFLAEHSGDPAGTVKFQLDDSVFWPEARQEDAAYIHRWLCGGAMPALDCQQRFCVGLLSALMHLVAGTCAWTASHRVHAYGHYMNILDSDITAIGRSGLTLFPDMNTMSRG
jgi:hypothetical protein